jgi:MFS family permease
MATFLASLDGTIIATALPRIASDFEAQSQMSWVATAYLLTYSKATIMTHALFVKYAFQPPEVIARY